MKDNPFWRFMADQVRITGLLIKYFYLHVRYLYLLIRYCLLKIEGAALIEAVEIWYSIKSMSKENRIIFAACIAVSIYGLALVTLIRL